MRLYHGGGTSPPSSPRPASRNPLATYQSLLERRPVLTKSVTAGVITAIGDILAQGIELRSKSLPLSFSSVPPSPPSPGVGAPLDLQRLFAFTLAGACFVGPFVHFWYELLWAIRRRLAESSGKTPGAAVTLLLVFLDQTIGACLFFPPYIVSYELFSAISAQVLPLLPLPAKLALSSPPLPLMSFVSKSNDRIRTSLLSILVANWSVWPFINFMSFTFVPEIYRGLFSNVASVFWNIYLCGKMGTKQ